MNGSHGFRSRLMESASQRAIICSQFYCRPPVDEPPSGAADAVDPADDRNGVELETVSPDSIVSMKRELACAAPEDKLRVLEREALKLHEQVTDGAFEKQEAMDALSDAAFGNDLFDKFGTEAVQHILSEAMNGRASLAPKTVLNLPRSTAARDRSLVVQCAADVAPESVEWLWPNRIALGKQTLIGGEPGLGKSQASIAIAATITNGGGWPCGEGRAPVGKVVFLCAEDGIADTVVPRLIAAGADVKNVHIISAVDVKSGPRRSFNLQADLDLLESEIAKIGDVRLVVIDPISSYMGKVDSHKNAEVRSVLEAVGEMADRLRVGVVGITHFAKGGGQKAIHSFIGSIGFIAAARAAFAVTQDPDDETRRLFMPVKNNLAAMGAGLAFRLEQRLLGERSGILASSIVWDSELITGTVDGILAANSDTSSGRSARTEAEDFLRAVLAGGPRASAEIEAEGKEAGVSWASVRRAKKQLGISADRRAESGDGLGASGRWYWSLPGAEMAAPDAGMVTS